MLRSIKFIAFFLFLVPFTRAFDFFNDGPSVGTESMLYLIDVGLDGVRGTIGCFGDFDSDKYNDLFIISEDKHEVNIYLWNQADFKFRARDNLIIKENGTILNIAGADFNYDGKLDLLVVGEEHDATTNESLYIHVYFGNYDSFSDVKNLPSSLSQPLIHDANADLLPDLFGTSESGERSFWINEGKAARFAVKQQGAGLPPLSSPHSNAFVDINGDCLSDLFITSFNPQENMPMAELWINKKGSFSLEKRFPLEHGVGQATFADLDSDGTIDVLFPVCNPQPSCSEESYISIIFNRQSRRLCENIWDTDCRSSTDLCSPDTEYMNGISMNMSETVANMIKVPISKTQEGYRFFVHPDYPLMLRTGDYNLDGYPDLLVPLVDAWGKEYIQIWENEPCGDSCRTFSPSSSSGMSALTKIQHAHAAAFFDLAENGIPDILVLVDDGKTQQIKAILNNFQNDAFFMKTLGLNGVCTSWCDSGAKFPNPKPYGVNYAGGVFKFTVTDLGGTKHIRQGGQLYQSSYLALQTPYTIFGLGRTSNYIEDFAYGVTINEPVHYNLWICIIPNSQLVAIPYTPKQPSDWQLELYISPSGLTLWVILGIFTSLLVLGVTVAFLQWREKQQDEKEKQENAHIFSFSAL